MPRFTPKRYEQILPNMIARVVSRTDLSDVSDASGLKHVLAAAARSDDEQYYQMTLLLKLFSIDTARKDDLDQRAREIQPGVVSRIQASKASGTVVFSRNGTSGTVSIPIGTRVKTADGVSFLTATVGTITPTSPEQISGHGVGRDSNFVSVTAELPGSAGNVSAGTVVRFGSKPAGVDEVTNLSSFTTGLDKETDDAFRNRLKLYIASLARCQVAGIESGVLGQSDPDTGQTILYAKAVEDVVNRGYVALYIDDGTGSAEAYEEAVDPLTASFTWNGTTTVTTADTSEVAVDDFIRLDADGKFFQILSIVPNTSLTIDAGGEVIPSGSGACSKAVDLITRGLAGPPPDAAVGGEERLWLDAYPVKDSLAFLLKSSVRGVLVDGVDYVYNPATGQIDFLIPLTAGEMIVAAYTYFTGLVALAQKIVDGDPNDRVNFPGYRAAGALVQVLTPQVLLQNVTAILTVADGYDQDSVRSAARQAIKDYINSLSISDDVIRFRLASRIINVPGVVNLTLTTPAADVIMLDDQLARVQDANILLS